MIADAFRAELAKALRHRGNLFWGFIFAPLVAVLVGIAITLWTRTHFSAGPPMPATNLAHAAFQSLGAPQNPFLGLFWIIGAAAIFAGEYRWATFRYMLVRNTRLGVLGAKGAVFLTLVAGSLLLVMLGDQLNAIVDAVVGHVGARPMAADGGKVAAGLLLAFGVGLLRLAGIGALVALASVLSRSMIGAIISILVLLVVEVIVAQRVGMFGPAWLAVSLPGLSYERLMADIGLMMGEGVRPPPMAGGGLGAVVCLLAWAGVPAAAAAVLFKRQDLSRE